ncbi:uncharacterized protein LOC121379886 [Gigantopelta aegis]|uniref:uncharacterized protein LOC121379886 n=1 Tax=Gigantopelta aegis TaxID=1735272 RepID=UPI001B88A273|nr:uncharacterized protein LOC121379886 [Gigantopelta aegis]
MFTSLVIFSFFLVSALEGSDPKKCCMPDEWFSYLSDLVLVTKGNLVGNTYSYSYKLKKVAVSSFEFVPSGGPSKPIVRTVFDYTQKKVFYIKPDGTCTSGPNTDKIHRPCIPDDATYLGSNYFGFFPIQLPFHAWKFQYVDSPKANITIVFTQEGCVPIVEGVSGKFNGAHTEGTFVFSGYEPEVKDKSVFKVPPGC